MNQRNGIVLLVLVLIVALLTGCKEATTVSALPSTDIYGLWQSTHTIVNDMGTVDAGAEFYIRPSTVRADYHWQGEDGDSSWTAVVSPDPATSVAVTLSVTASTGTAPEVDDTLTLAYIMSGSDSVTLIVGSDVARCIRIPIPDL